MKDIRIWQVYTRQPSSINYTELQDIYDKGRAQTHFFPSGNRGKCILIYNTRAVLSAQSTCYILWSFIIINLLTSINKLFEVRFKGALDFPGNLSVKPLTHVWPFVTPWTVACQASLSITNSWSLLKLMSIELVMPSKHLILWCPILLPSIFPSIRAFSSGSVLHIRWPKIGVSASVLVLPMNIQDWFPLGLTDSISWQSKGLSRVLNTTVQKYQCNLYCHLFSIWLYVS